MLDWIRETWKSLKLKKIPFNIKKKHQQLEKWMISCRHSCLCLFIVFLFFYLGQYATLNNFSPFFACLFFIRAIITFLSKQNMHVKHTFHFQKLKSIGSKKNKAFPFLFEVLINFCSINFDCPLFFLLK